jgi:hypothetical protein
LLSVHACVVGLFAVIKPSGRTLPQLVCGFCTPLRQTWRISVSDSRHGRSVWRLRPFQKFLEELVFTFSFEPWWRVRLFRSVARNRCAGRFRRVYRRDLGRRGGSGLLASHFRLPFASLNQLPVRCVGHAIRGRGSGSTIPTRGCGISGVEQLTVVI